MLLLCPFVDPLQVGDTLQAGTGLLHTGPSSSHSRQASQDTSPPRDGHTKRTGPPACTHVKPLVGPCLLTSRGSEQSLRLRQKQRRRRATPPPPAEGPETLNCKEQELAEGPAKASGSAHYGFSYSNQVGVVKGHRFLEGSKSFLKVTTGKT